MPLALLQIPIIYFELIQRFGRLANTELGYIEALSSLGNLKFRYCTTLYDGIIYLGYYIVCPIRGLQPYTINSAGRL